MEVREKDIGDIRVISLSGELTAETAEPLRAAVARALPEPGRIVLDLAEMKGIDRAGIGVLSILRALTKENGQSLKLACLQVMPRSVFNMLKVCSLFEMYDTLPAALEALRS